MKRASAAFRPRTLFCYNMPVMAEENKEKLLEVEEVRQRIAELKTKVGEMAEITGYALGNAAYRAKLLARIRRGDDHAKVDYSDQESQDLAKLMQIPDIKPRSLFKLDDNLVTALEMAEKIKDTEAKLPSINCCACGAPSCSALAEDIIRGEACLENCIFAHKDIDELYEKMEDIWGKVVKL